MYHRVIDPETCEYPIQAGMYVRPETFEMQMRFLAETKNIVSIKTIAECFEKGEALPENTLSITFDDGWIDNYEFAFPILKKFNIPACIFLPTHFIGTNEWFWTDRLSLALYKLRQNKNAISGGPLTGVGEARVQKALSSENDETFFDCLDLCILELKKIKQIKRNEIIEFLLEASTAQPHQRLFMNWNEIREMEQSGIQFGNHSHSHRMFSRLTKQEIVKELEISKTQLKLNLSNPLNIFCYPEGDFSIESHEALSSLGTSTLISNRRASHINSNYKVIGRIGIHEDISNSKALMSCRIHLSNIF